MDKTLYKILGIKKSSTTEEIKKAFREKVKKHHPDKNNGNHSEEYQLIVAAYETLSDPLKRKKYDRTGVNSFVTSRENDVLKTMYSFINQALRSQGINADNFVRHLKSLIKKDIKKEEKALEQAKIHAETLKEIIKQKGKGEDRKAVRNIGNPYLQEILESIQKIEYAISVYTECLENVHVYEDETDEVVMNVMFRGININSTSTF